MNLRNNRITVGEILSSPRARAVLARSYPMLLQSPLLFSVKNLSLGRVISMAGKRISPKKLQELLTELEKC